MIIGFVKVENGAVNTHRDSYLLENLNVVSVRRPLVGAGFLGALGCSIFSIGFFDLLYLSELMALGSIGLVSMAIGHQVAQLKLISRETKGTELAGAVWGSAGTLQKIRADIVAQLRAMAPHQSSVGGRS